MAKRKISVAGDVCIDAIGVPKPRPAADPSSETANWRLTGEIRTRHTVGGALLLTEMVKAAVPDGEVNGPELQTPDALRCGKSAGPLERTLITRLTRDEIVHSVLRVDQFKTNAKADKKDQTLRVALTEGFSGPDTGEPTIEVKPPAGEDAEIIVLDDTGNPFRHAREQWPAVLKTANSDRSRVIVHKLHRPLPVKPPSSGNLEEDARVQSQSKASFPLWYALCESHPLRRLVVISVDDLRLKDALISRGLSWERTATDLVWQLLNVPMWEELRDTPHLVVRLGVDGAVYWRYDKAHEKEPYKAWLIYDPQAIEGSTEDSFAGKMVGYASAFTAGLVRGMSGAEQANLLENRENADGSLEPPAAILKGIRIGLLASRRLLELGYGKKVDSPEYPGAALFEEPKRGKYPFACQRIPLIPAAAEPDRGHWRLIDAIFSGKTDLLHRAVGMVARGAKAEANENGTAEEKAQYLLDQVPLAVFAGALRAYDRREMESYRSLYALMNNYTRIKPEAVTHPLCVAVFGPPGAGKSFGVKMVAKALGESETRTIETLTFNLSQYQTPEQLAAAFHQVRDVVLRGKIPLVFFDEFDTALDGKPLGWLRYFLSPMQDAEFLDRGTPHPIGQSIFVFAGGTCGSYADFARPLTEWKTEVETKTETENGTESDVAKRYREFKDAKGPDFLSRLRGTLDIPGLDLNPRFDAYGPPDAFPCEAAIMLRRANILAFQLGQKAPDLQDGSRAYQVSDSVVRALIHLPRFEHGNRSFEAVLEMSRLVGQTRFTPSLLPSLGQAGLHANAAQLLQLLGTDYPYPPREREEIAKSIHQAYIEDRKAETDYNPDDPSVQPWEKISESLKDSNYQQADHIASKLQSVGLWFRKPITGASTEAKAKEILKKNVEMLAEQEHDRWVAEKRRAGWLAAPNMERESKNGRLRLHNFIFPWKELTDAFKKLDRTAVQRISEHLKKAGYEIFVP